MNLFLIRTARGSHRGTLLSCLQWQAEHQGALATIEDCETKTSTDVDDLPIAYDEALLDDLSPEGVQQTVLSRIQAAWDVERPHRSARPDVHVTAVRDGAVYGHAVTGCDPSGCAGNELFLGDDPGGIEAGKVYSAEDGAAIE